jgi:predicted MPP superfamily phosphohydrolase
MLLVRHPRMELAGWPSELRIAVLSDLHIGSPHVGLDKLQRIVEETNAENPALVVLLGDFVIGGPGGRHDASFVAPEQTAEGLKKLRAPLGVYAVLGNHDWWYDGERVRKALTDAGIPVLENRAVRVGPIWLGGIADLWTREPDVAGTLKQVASDDPVVLITHNPDIFPDVPPRVSLLLAAHTHGGQVNLPLIGRVVTTSRLGYVAGEYAEKGRHLFVTTGIGTSILPVRLGVPPEIVILTVTPGAAGNSY